MNQNDNSISSSSAGRDQTNIREVPCKECIAKYIPPFQRQIFRRKRGLKNVTRPNDVSLIEMVFKSDTSLPSKTNIFYKRNITWRALKPADPIRYRLPEPKLRSSEYDKENSEDQELTDSSQQQNSDSTDDGSAFVAGRCPSCNSLVTDIDNDMDFRNVENSDYESSSSDSTEDEYEWDENEEIISHKLTQLDVPEKNESKTSFNNRIKCKKIRLIKDVSELPQNLRGDKTLHKYWFNRYEIFHKYDDGIQLDTESWYSVTPERIAKQIARRCKCDIIIDAFCGAGGNAIQFAFTCNKVIAIDIDPMKIEYAKNNAKIYGVEEKIEFINGDFFQLAPKLKADIVFLSPPWGGPAYTNTRVYDMNLLPPVGGKYVYKIARRISTNIAYFLPKNINIRQVRMLAKKGHCMEIEQYLEGEKVIAITCYYGELVTKINQK